MLRPPPRIVALGGHEFRSRPPDLAMLEHLLALTGADRPRVCLMPTAGGDPREAISSFYAILDRYDCVGSHVSLFRLERERVDLFSHLLAQDLIYVTGGSLVNLLAVWRAHELPTLMHRAWQEGVLIAGQSAGAMCWFEHAITASSGVPRPVPGLGFLSGSLCVHYDRDSGRRSAYTAAIAGGLEPGFALDDGAGLLFEGGRAVEAVAGARGARVLHVGTGPDGVTETPLHPTPVLPRTRNGDPAIAELRALRPVRAGGLRPLTVPPA